jgi:hypothetical protein
MYHQNLLAKEAEHEILEDDKDLKALENKIRKKREKE